MTTTVSIIRKWLARADETHTHMLIVCDTFNYEDYPVFVKQGDDPKKLQKNITAQTCKK